jgi:ribosomal protein L11 methyltransferase
LIRLALAVRRADGDRALAQLLDLAPAGVEEVDISSEVIEYVVYGAPDELAAANDFAAALGGALISVSSTEVADDWAERWREFHQPLRLGGRLCVRPPWIPAAGTELDLVIDPGQAFGTGAHATTALCLGMLLDLTLPGGDDRSVIDLGCGSGVLGILAARLGWGPVVALDHDPLAVTATRGNAVVNGVALDEVRRFDLYGSEPVPPARLVLANLLAPLLRDWCAQAVRASTVIASGLLSSEADPVAAGFARHGFELADRQVQGEWAALLLISRVA